MVPSGLEPSGLEFTTQYIIEAIKLAAAIVLMVTGRIFMSLAKKDSRILSLYGILMVVLGVALLLELVLGGSS